MKLPLFQARIRERWPVLFRRGDHKAIAADLDLLESRHGIIVDHVIINWPANRAIAKIMEVIEATPGQAPPRPNVELDIRGIKCDTPDCNWRDDTVSPDNYREWLNRPCPRCNANLLTQADFDTVQKLYRAAELANAAPPAPPDAPRFHGKIHFDGSGEIQAVLEFPKSQDSEESEIS